MSSQFAPAIDALDAAVRSSAQFRAWLRSRRWCGDAIGMRADLAVKDRAVLKESGTEVLVLFLAVAREPEVQVVVHLPVSLSTVRTSPDAYELRAGAQRLYVTEAERREGYANFLVEGFQRQQKIRTETGDAVQFHGSTISAFRGIGPEVAADTSNLLMRIETADRAVVFKSYKLLDVQNREPDILKRLHAKGFRHIPRYIGELALGRGPDRLVLGVATEHVEATDLFAWFVHGWSAELAESGRPSIPFEPSVLDLVDRLGDATATLHEALSDRHPGPFRAETFGSEDATAARRTAIANLGATLRRLATLERDTEKQVAGLAARTRALLFEHRAAIEETLRGLDAGIGTPKSVTHGDFHLAQVLLGATDGELRFIDFEGEPARPPGQRSLPLPPLRDVATMIRSFSYVTHYAWREFLGGDLTAALSLLDRERLPESERAVADRLLAWEGRATNQFIRAYLVGTRLYPGLTEEAMMRFLRGWMMEKALYELRYELAHRPANILIPLEGILALTTGSGLGPTPVK